MFKLYKDNILSYMKEKKREILSFIVIRSQFLVDGTKRQLLFTNCSHILVEWGKWV